MSLFFRLHTDHTESPVELEGMYAGPRRTACWLIGGGPSLADLPCHEIAAAPIPRMCLNLSGTKLFRPNFWTSYDPSVRFHRSIYLDAGVTKFVHRRRAMDLVPETTFKVCECPNLYFFERDGERGFADFVQPGTRGIVDWADSFVQGIDILYRLGFRTVYLAGCELRVRASTAQMERGAQAGVTYDPQGLLQDYLKQCELAGIAVEELERCESGAQYHFGEQKPLRAAAQTDSHYFRIVQYLRLSRRALSLAGLELISVTPDSRLNDHFSYQPVETVLHRLTSELGDPGLEPTVGQYTRPLSPTPAGSGPMRDLRPHNWPADGKRRREPDLQQERQAARAELRAALAGLPEEI